MAVSRKTLTIAETLFQDEVMLDIDVKTSNSLTILDVLNANKISINQSCGGSGTCGTCRILVPNQSNFVNKKSDYETESSKELNLIEGQRLSCQTEINKFSTETELKIQIVNEFVVDN
jgi:ferredoxin